MNRSLALFRIAAVILLLFATGHTYGFLGLIPSTLEARAVRASMDAVAFPMGSHTYTYGAFYTGFGLFVSAALLFMAAVAWRLGSMSRRAAPDTRFLGALLTLLMLVNAAICLRCFGPVQVGFSVAVALATGAATLLLPAAPPSSR